MSRITYRIIASESKTLYILTPDTMHTAQKHSQHEVGGDYDFYNCDGPSLSKGSVRRIFRLKSGYCRTATKHCYHFSLNRENNVLNIGCQTFKWPAIQAMKRWLGLI